MVHKLLINFLFWQPHSRFRTDVNKFGLLVQSKLSKESVIEHSDKIPVSMPQCIVRARFDFGSKIFQYVKNSLNYNSHCFYDCILIHIGYKVELHVNYIVFIV